MALVLLAGALVVGSGGTARAEGEGPGANSSASGCPTLANHGAFASERKLRDLTRRVAGFGLRSPASPMNAALLRWLERGLRRTAGLRVRSEAYSIRRWQPTPKARRLPGRDLGAAGRMSLVDSPGAEGQSFEVAGALPFAKPGYAGGQLVYLPPEEKITAGNARGKVVLRDFKNLVIPNAVFAALAYNVTPDDDPNGKYDRPYLTTQLPEDMLDAGRAGAAGVIMGLDVPQRQVRGYWDPHDGTFYRVPAVYVGLDEREQLKQRAARGQLVRVGVRARVDQARTRNLIATLPGRSRERVILYANSDGNTWVQENANAGLLALARYLARLPRRCRSKTIEFASTASHLGYSTDGVDRVAERANREYDHGKVAFTFGVEHLGTREILPRGPTRRLEFTGRSDPQGWFVGPSKVLQDATIKAVYRRRVARSAVLPGQDVPDRNRAPAHCSFGGIGTAFHSRLVPTVATISGPWSLWAPSFGERALDFQRMRRQLLAVGDVVRSLDEVPREQIAGDYVRERQRRRAGAQGCDLTPPPVDAPGS